jgi:hypothetical protein
MAIASGEPSVAELRRDAERTRTQLTGTVDELRTQVADTASHIKDAVAPSAIKRQVSEYVRESRENIVQNLQRRARENPLQAVAIGAGLAYPVWNLMRAIPAPLLLIGAGLALSRSTAVQDATDRTIAQVRESVSEASDVARTSMHDARDTAGSMLDRATGALSAAKERVVEAVSSSSKQTAYTATAGAEKASNAMNAAGESVSGLATKTKDALAETYEQNPLLIAGIGLAVGALIASALPATTAENRMFGDTSEKLRRRASEAAAQGLDAAKDMASDVVDAAGQQGLSAEGLSTAAGEVTQKARSVADRAVKTAFGDSTH